MFFEKNQQTVSDSGNRVGGLAMLSLTAVAAPSEPGQTSGSVDKDTTHWWAIRLVKSEPR